MTNKPMLSVEKILIGIDKDETEHPDGWWPNSVGAEFGAKKLQELRAFLDKPDAVASADNQVMACPHCGTSAYLTMYSGNPAIFCDNDLCEGSMGGEEYPGTEDELVAAWNRRAPDAKHQREPVAVFSVDASGYRAKVILDHAKPFPPDGTQLYAEQPAPVAVVMPERKCPSEYRDATYTQTCMAGEYNRALEEIARLNGVKP